MKENIPMTKFRLAHLGLVMAAIIAAAMSNLSAALNSLASTSIMDFYKPLRPGRPEPHYLALARWSTLAWGAILFAIGLLSQGVNSVLEAGLGIASILYGGLLGVFLLGITTRRVGERPAMLGMAAGILLNLGVALFTPLAWTWYVLVGSSVTFLTALAASFIMETSAQHA